jgi:hypothetical protein
MPVPGNGRPRQQWLSPRPRYRGPMAEAQQSTYRNPDRPTSRTGDDRFRWRSPMSGSAMQDLNFLNICHGRSKALLTIWREFLSERPSLRRARASQGAPAHPHRRAAVNGRHDIQPTYRVIAPDRTHTAGVCATSEKVERPGVEPTRTGGDSTIQAAAACATGSRAGAAPTHPRVRSNASATTRSARPTTDSPFSKRG